MRSEDVRAASDDVETTRRETGGCADRRAAHDDVARRARSRRATKTQKACASHAHDATRTATIRITRDATSRRADVRRGASVAHRIATLSIAPSLTTSSARGPAARPRRRPTRRPFRERRAEQANDDADTPATLTST